jgi:hypothetical protein
LSIDEDFSFNHSWNFSSACSSLSAPFITPFLRWFFNKTPL